MPQGKKASASLGDARLTPSKTLIEHDGMILRTLFLKILICLPRKHNLHSFMGLFELTVSGSMICHLLLQ